MDPRRLRDETRAEHEATEALMPLGGDGLTLDLYVQTLQVMYPLVYSWERWASEAAPEVLKPLLAKRQRSHLLAADIRHLRGALPAMEGYSVDWAAVVTGGESHATADEYSARFLAAMYVMEGSTLGGRYIARHVESQLGLAPGEGDLYFQGHGEATGAMWREITAQIVAIPEPFAPVVVSSASRAFRAFGDALRAGVACADVMHS